MSARWFEQIVLWPRRVVMGMIRLYQHTLSPDHGLLRGRFPYGYCRFQPSCSQYGYEAIAKYGVVRGGLLALWRILRCNPFSTGGSDPVR